MWFSWKEARHGLTESDVVPRPDKINRSHGKSIFGQTLLLLESQSNIANTASISSRSHPTPSVVREIWSTFLANVHPLVKIFFSWQMEPTIRIAAEKPESLSQEHECLMFSIYFISVLSMQEDRCHELLAIPRSEALDHYQGLAELSLLQAGFIDTGSRAVLQAFLLYLVSSQGLW